MMTERLLNLSILFVCVNIGYSSLLKKVVLLMFGTLFCVINLHISPKFYQYYLWRFWDIQTFTLTLMFHFFLLPDNWHFWKVCDQCLDVKFYPKLWVPIFNTIRNGAYLKILCYQKMKKTKPSRYIKYMWYMWVYKTLYKVQKNPFQRFFNLMKQI